MAIFNQNNMLSDFAFEDMGGGGGLFDSGSFNLQDLMNYAAPLDQQSIGAMMPTPEFVPEAPMAPMVAPVQQQQEQPKVENKQAVIDNLTKQILGSSDTSKWTGGVGAEQAAKDMAKIMAGIGITDISQFGKITQTGLQEDVRPDGRGGYVDQRGNPVDPNIVQTGSYETEGGRIDYATAPIGTQVTYGNKETNQAVPITYSERQTGNAFGGTFEGKGNTGYRVDFDASGKPVFYTTGASSRDDIGVFAPIIAASLLPVLGPAAAGLLGSGASTLATNALTGALVGGSTAAITGDSIAKGALLGGAGGALSDIISPYLPSAPTELTERQFAIADAKQLASSGIPTDQISEILSAGGYNDAIVNRAMDAIATAPVAVTAPTTQPPIETVQVSAPVAPTPTVNEIINAIVSQQPIPEVVAPVETVQVTEPVQPTTPTINELINAFAQTPVTLPPIQPQPVETVQVSTPSTAEPNVGGLLSSVIQEPVQQVPTPVEITAPRVEEPKTAEQPSTALIPELVMTGQAPKEPEQPIAPIIAPAIQPVLPELTTIAERPSTITNETEPAPVIVAPPIDTTLPKSDSNPLSNLTPSQIANILKGAAGLFGAVNASKVAGGGSTAFNVGALPTQGIPLNSQDYFNAIQQNYNSLLPALPRDVATPLANWYNSQYGA